jgi:hypothetical protein
VLAARYLPGLAERTLKTLLRTPATAHANMARQCVARSFAFGLVPEEIVMSITAWIVPVPAADWAADDRQSGWANR